MSESILIYVAGNPELYPLEYYDAQSGEYRGAIPELLADFAAEEGYELVYYEAGASDRRSQMSANLQVDLVSGAVSGERFENTAGRLVLYETDGASCGVAFTESAPESFVNALTAYAAERTAADVTGELLAASEPPAAGNSLAIPAIAALAVALCAALAALALVWRRGKRRISAAGAALGVDPDTGFPDRYGFEKAFGERVNANNRPLYFVLSFRFKLEHIGRVGGPGEIRRFRSYAAGVLRRFASGDDALCCGEAGSFLVLRQAENELAASGWASSVLGEIRGFPATGAGLGAGDASAGVFSLAYNACGWEEAAYYAGQCAEEAGDAGQDVLICGEGQRRAFDEERVLLADMQRALENGEFQLSLQFFVSGDGGRIEGGEALSRWLHPKLGLLGANRFIPLFEREKRIDKLDLYILERSCRFLQRLREAGAGDFYISCNFSRCSFSQPGIIERCREIIERYDFPRRELIIEITESGRIEPEQDAQMRENIIAVRSMGLRVMLDDFGMGYATFHDLQDYPMDGLKLDKSLVDKIDTQQGREIIDCIVRTGHDLGLVILAEGVEKEWQAQMLRELGCDYMQGYLFAVPLPEDEAARRIAGREKTDA